VRENGARCRSEDERVRTFIIKERPDTDVVSGAKHSIARTIVNNESVCADEMVRTVSPPLSIRVEKEVPVIHPLPRQVESVTQCVAIVDSGIADDNRRIVILD
jgi:hypothetical protein